MYIQGDSFPRFIFQVSTQAEDDDENSGRN